MITIISLWTADWSLGLGLTCPGLAEPNSWLSSYVMFPLIFFALRRIKQCLSSTFWCLSISNWVDFESTKTGTKLICYILILLLSWCFRNLRCTVGQTVSNKNVSNVSSLQRHMECPDIHNYEYKIYFSINSACAVLLATWVRATDIAF